MCNIARLCVILPNFSFQKNETPGNACNMCNMCNIDRFQFPKKMGPLVMHVIYVILTDFSF